MAKLPPYYLIQGVNVVGNLEAVGIGSPKTEEQLVQYKRSGRAPNKLKLRCLKQDIPLMTTL
eukprot:1524257-Karenia_brevis.AAC.1